VVITLSLIIVPARLKRPYTADELRDACDLGGYGIDWRPRRPAPVGDSQIHTGRDGGSAYAVHDDPPLRRLHRFAFEVAGRLVLIERVDFADLHGILGAGSPVPVHVAVDAGLFEDTD